MPCNKHMLWLGLAVGLVGCSDAPTEVEFALSKGDGMTAEEYPVINVVTLENSDELHLSEFKKYIQKIEHVHRKVAIWGETSSDFEFEIGDNLKEVEDDTIRNILTSYYNEENEVEYKKLFKADLERETNNSLSKYKSNLKQAQDAFYKKYGDIQSKVDSIVQQPKKVYNDLEATKKALWDDYESKRSATIALIHEIIKTNSIPISTSNIEERAVGKMFDTDTMDPNSKYQGSRKCDLKDPYEVTSYWCYTIRTGRVGKDLIKYPEVVNSISKTAQSYAYYMHQVNRSIDGNLRTKLYIAEKNLKNAKVIANNQYGEVINSRAYKSARSAITSAEHKLNRFKKYDLPKQLSRHYKGLSYNKKSVYWRNFNKNLAPLVYKELDKQLVLDFKDRMQTIKVDESFSYPYGAHKMIAYTIYEMDEDPQPYRVIGGSCIKSKEYFEQREYEYSKFQFKLGSQYQNRYSSLVELLAERATCRGY